MTIGLLICDHVPERHLVYGGTYIDMFQNLLPDLQFEIFDLVHGQFPASTTDCDAYLVTGSKYSVYDEIEWILQLKDLVAEIQHEGLGYLGICFGHQMLAEALDGKVSKNEEGWCVGTHRFDVIQRETWMRPERDFLNLLMCCQDQVKELPSDSTVLATAEDCPMAMFQTGQKMLAIQGHPEFPKEYNKAIMNERVGRIDPKKVEKGLQSLSTELDADIFARWAVQFLHS